MCDQDNQPQTLATVQGLGSITLCPCGTVSINVGGVSVRLEPSAFAQTAEMCRIALAALKVEALALQSAAANSPSGMTH
jgi:hypothetical protein